MLGILHTPKARSCVNCVVGGLVCNSQILLYTSSMFMPEKNSESYVKTPVFCLRIIEKQDGFVREKQVKPKKEQGLQTYIPCSLLVKKIYRILRLSAICAFLISSSSPRTAIGFGMKPSISISRSAAPFFKSRYRTSVGSHSSMRS